MLSTKLTTAPLICLLLATLVCVPPGHADNLGLTYDRPATDWQKEALPLGNGRIGAMVFGNFQDELITLNEDSLWSGAPYEWDSSAGKPYLPEIRQLVLAERFGEASQLVRELQGAYSQSYMPLGNLRLRFNGTEDADYYRRQLDISDALATVVYQAGSYEYRRTIFVSHPDQVMVVRLETDNPSGLDVDISLDSVLSHNVARTDNGDFVMQGHAPIHVAPAYQRTENPVIQHDEHRGTGMRFAVRVRIKSVGGTIDVNDQRTSIKGSHQATLLVAIDTSFNGFDKLPDEQGVDETVQPRLDIDAAAQFSDAELLDRHKSDYHSLFNRVTFDLGGHERRNLLTPDRLSEAASGASDPDLAVLLFQYGRYLLISSSRPGTQPANLQGIWNDKLRPPWSSNYTININTEMNYWLAESTNLSELHEPLLRMIEELAVTGRRTADVTYGMSGWCAHHNVDLWRLSCPVGDYGEGDPVWANWQMGGPWLCQHLWEHYRFTNNKEFLRDKAYPVMKGAAEFVLDYLVEDSAGRLVTIPSTSPENKFIWQGEAESVSMGSTSDMALVWDLFTNLIEASEILDIDQEFRQTLLEKREQLLSLQISPSGTLLEWYRDFDEADPHHRHTSHLIALHPGRQISPLTTPELADAARKTLEARGDEGTGWSLAWKINFWARLHDGNHAHRLLTRLLRPTGLEEGHGGGGVYLNLLDTHPPFQIDGNFGATNGICEMLLQSHMKAPDGSVLAHLLPALPSAWPNGQITGLQLRGGATADLKWRDGRLIECNLKSVKSPITLKYEDLQRTILPPADEVVVGGTLADLSR